MSYDLYFWRQDETVADSASVLLQKLSAEPVPGVSFPDIPTLQAKVIEALPAFSLEVHTPTQVMLSRRESGAFDLGWASQHISALAYGDVSGDDWNAIIDVMNAAGMAVYDPQIGERFLQPNSPE